MLLSYVGVFTAVTPAVVGLWRLGNGCGALVDRLVHDRAPHPMKLHHHSGSLFFPLREGRPVQMHLECGGVPVHFVRESLPIEARHIEIDGKAYPYYDACFVWADPATTCGLPATAAPIDRSPT